MTWEATVIVPGEMQEHRIGYLGAETERTIAEDEIRDLCEPTTCDGIVGRQFDVPLPKNIANGAALRVFHAHIVARLRLRI